MMDDIQPTDLRYFLETARTLNISRAAERLNMGQPALSQSLQRLESVVGAKLFDRFKTGVQLTAAGRKLANEGRSALGEWERLKQAALSSESEIEGSYSIGCHPSVGIYSLPAFLKELLGNYPRLEINLRHGLSREVLEDVISFRSDFGLVMNPVRHPDLVIRQLCEDQVSFWASKNSDRETLICDPALAQTQFLLKKMERKQIFGRYLHSSSLEVIASLAEAGCGVAILPERIARRHAGLTCLKEGLPKVRDQLCLIYRADRKIAAAGRKIVEAIARAKI